LQGRLRATATSWPSNFNFKAREGASQFIGNIRHFLAIFILV